MNKRTCCCRRGLLAVQHMCVWCRSLSFSDEHVGRHITLSLRQTATQLHSCRRRSDSSSGNRRHALGRGSGRSCGRSRGRSCDRVLTVDARSPSVFPSNRSIDKACGAKCPRFTVPTAKAMQNTLDVLDQNRSAAADTIEENSVSRNGSRGNVLGGLP